MADASGGVGETLRSYLNPTSKLSHTPRHTNPCKGGAQGVGWAADVAGAFRVVGEDEVHAGVGQWAGNLNS